jgi:hypothetical protein
MKGMRRVDRPGGPYKIRAGGRFRGMQALPDAPFFERRVSLDRACTPFFVSKIGVGRLEMRRRLVHNLRSFHVSEHTLHRGDEMREQWSTSQEEEDLYRRRLFARASKGEVKATKELQETYGVRLWSAQERSQLEYENPQFNGKIRRSRIQKKTASTN